MEKTVFMEKLKATLDAIITQNKALESRLAAIEHSVNDVIIGGLVDAANEYEDNENFSIFTDTYGAHLTPYAEHCKVLNGEDYDIIEEMYEGSKGKEDVAAYVAEEIAKIEAKINALKGLTAEPEVEVVVEEEPSTDENTVDEKDESMDEDKEEVDEEELARIAKEML